MILKKSFYYADLVLKLKHFLVLKTVIIYAVYFFLIL